jgi:hypothetical protein
VQEREQTNKKTSTIEKYLRRKISKRKVKVTYSKQIKQSGCKEGIIHTVAKERDKERRKVPYPWS